MTWFVVPPLDPEPWPTLGPEICDWIEDSLVHGPGDVLGKSVELTDEQRLFVWRAYEVFPRNHELAGRRRWKRVVLSRRKGWSKTELAAWIAIAELDPTAPMRCDGWRQEDGVWIPVGRPVLDPYIPMVSTGEDQTEELAFGAAFAILTQDTCPLVNDYDVGLERITHRVAPGKIQPLASAPNARDGARTTHQHFDETHLFISPRLKNTHATMNRNIPKRREADAWGLETTTMYAPGEDSIAEESHHHALDIAAGRVEDPSMLFDHRQAAEEHDISTREGLVLALKEASGDAWAFADVDGIIRTQFRDPQVKEADACRYWLNQARVSEKTWIPPKTWDARSAETPAPILAAQLPPDPDPKKKRAAVKPPAALGFKGTYDDTAAALVGCTPDGHIFTLGVWEDLGDEDYLVPRDEVDAAVHDAMRAFKVARLAWDPPGWYEEGEAWAKTYGKHVAVRVETRKTVSYTAACGKFYTAATTGALTHDGSEPLARHLRNATPRKLKDGRYIVSDGKVIVAAVAAVLAYEQASAKPRDRRMRSW